MHMSKMRTWAEGSGAGCQTKLRVVKAEMSFCVTTGWIVMSSHLAHDIWGMDTVI